MNDLEQRLHAALQRQADDVQPHPHAEAEFARRLAQRRTPRLRWQPFMMGIAAAVVVLVVVLGVLLARNVAHNRGKPAHVPSPPPGLVQLSVPLPRTPTALATAQGAVWLVDPDGELHRYDVVSGELKTLGALPEWRTGAIAAGLGGLWVADVNDDSVLRVDATTGQVARLAVTQTGVVTVSETHVWAEVANERLASLDPDTGEIVRTVPLPGRPDAVAEYFGDLWVASGHTLYRISPSDGRVLSTADLPAIGTSIAGTSASLWVAAGDQLVRFDPTGREQGANRITGLRSLSADHIGSTVYAVDDHGSVIAESESGQRVTLRIAGDPLVGPADSAAAVWVSTPRALLRLAEFGQ